MHLNSRIDSRSSILLIDYYIRQAGILRYNIGNVIELITVQLYIYGL